MKGFILASILTLFFVLFAIAFLVASLLLSLVLHVSQAQRTVSILGATERPLSITSGLLETKLLDGRTLLDESLHALGGAPLAAPPLASRAIQAWDIARWEIVVAGGGREMRLGVSGFDECFAQTGSGLCAADCPVGSFTIPGATQCGGRSCCSEDYDWDSKAYRPSLLAGSVTCGPEDGYSGVCEPGGCSPGRKDTGLSNCPQLPIGNHCCRPFGLGERVLLEETAVDSVIVPLLYPGMSGNLTVSVSSPQAIATFEVKR